MRISVIIPAFNEEKTIENCLTNLINQQEKPDEIIVVDNLSTDQTFNIVKKFTEVILIEAKVSGIAKARDVGFNAARYDIIARCDADSQVPKDWIKKIKSNFRQEKIDALIGPIIYYDLPLNSTIFAKIYVHLMNFVQGHHSLIGNNMAISKAIWEKVRDKVCSNNKIFHEDIDLAIHINKLGGIIKYDPLFVGYTSGRRIAENPISFFIEYPLRLVKTLKSSRH